MDNATFYKLLATVRQFPRPAAIDSSPRCAVPDSAPPAPRPSVRRVQRPHIHRSLGDTVLGKHLRRCRGHGSCAADSRQPKPPSPRPIPARQQPVFSASSSSRLLCSTVAVILSTSPDNTLLPLLQPTQRLLQQSGCRFQPLRDSSLLLFHAIPLSFAAHASRSRFISQPKKAPRAEPLLPTYSLTPKPLQRFRFRSEQNASRESKLL